MKKKTAIKYVNDKTCEWGYVSEFEHSHYIAECGYEFEFMDDRDGLTDYDFKYCPKCGNKIKEKTDEKENSN